MKAAKYVLALAALMGLLGVFAPLLTIHKRGVAQAFSARDLLTSGEAVQRALGGKWAHRLTTAREHLPEVAQRHLPATLRSLRQDLDDLVFGTRAAAMTFIPCLVLTLLAAIVVYRQRFRRTAAGLAVFLGAASCVGSVGLRWGIREYGPDAVQITLAYGAWLPLACGVLAMAAGGLALSRPDTGQQDSATRKAPAT